MKQINTTCPSNPSKVLEGDLSGSKLVLTSLSLCIQSVICVYLIRKMWCCCTNGNCRMNKTLRCIVSVYHSSFMLWLILLEVSFMEPVFSESTYDLSSLPSCIINNNLVLLPLTPLYVSLVLFWFYRLKGVFKNSKYQISKRLSTIIVCWTFAACTCSVI